MNTNAADLHLGTTLSRRLFTLGILLAASLTGLTVRGATMTWQTTGSSTNWSDTTGWSGGVVPGSGDVAQYSGATTATITVDGTYTIAGLVYNYNSSNSTTWNINTGSSGNPTLTLSPGGVVSLLGSHDSLTVNTPIILSGDAYFQSNSNGTLSLTKTISGTGNILVSDSVVNSVMSFSTFNNAGQVTFGPLASPVTSGGYTFPAISGAKFVAQVSSFGSNVTNINVNEGTLKLTGGSAFTTGNILNIASGATLELNGNGAIFNDSTPIFNNGTVDQASATTNQVTYSFNSNVNAGTLSGQYMSIIKYGTGTLTLSGNTTWGAGDSSHSDATTLRSGVMVGTGTSGTPFGAGKLTSYSQLQVTPTTVSPTAGLSLVAASTTSATSATTFTYGGGSSVVLNRGGNASLTFTVGASNGTTNALLVRDTSTLPNGTLIIAPTGGTGASNLGVLESFKVNSTTASALPTVTNGIVNTSIVGQNNDANLSGDFLTYDTTKGFVIATYDSSTDINGGVAGNTRVFNATASTNNTLSGNTTVYALRNNGQNISGAYTLSIGSGTSGQQSGLIMNGGTISVASLSFGSAEGTIYTSAANATIFSQIAGGSVTIFGPGVLSLTNANNFGSSLVTIEGAVNIGAAGNLGTGTLDVFGGTVQTSGTLTLSGANSIKVAPGQNSNGVTFDVDGNGILSVTRTIVNVGISGGVTKTGTGTLLLNASNTYSAGTTSSAGTLIAGKSTTVSSGSITNGPFGTGVLALTGGTLDSNGAAVTLANSLTLGGTIGLGTQGTGGSLTFNSTGLNTAATVTLTGATTLVVNNTTTIADSILNSGNYTLTKQGAGLLSLTGTTTGSGATTISAGTLAIAKGNSLGSGLISLSNGATLQYAGDTGTLSQNITVTSGTGLVNNAGGSNLTLSGTLTKADSKLVLNAGGHTIDVTGAMVSTGAVGAFDSDLYVTNGTVIADNSQSTYAGATHVYGNGTLVNGFDNALPSNTVVELGNSDATAAESGASFTNIYSLNGHSQSIAGLTTSNPAGFTDTNSVIGGSSTLSTLTLTGTATLGAGTFGGAGTNANNLALKFAAGSGNTVSLTGANTYAGGTEVASGILSVSNASGSATGTGSLLIDSGATLRGSGIVNSTTNTINGNVIVGNGGTDTTSQLVVSAAGSTVFNNANLTFNLDAASVQSNTLNFQGTPSVQFGLTGTTLTLNLLGTSAHDIASGTDYVLFTASSGSDYTDLATNGGKITNFNLNLVGLASNGASDAAYY